MRICGTETNVGGDGIRTRIFTGVEPDGLPLTYAPKVVGPGEAFLSQITLSRPAALPLGIATLLTDVTLICRRTRLAKRKVLPFELFCVDRRT